MKVAVFDFCETLIDFQTADEFVRFIISATSPVDAERILKKLKLKVLFIKACHRCGLMRSVNTKMVYLDAVKGISVDETERLAGEYYENRVKPHIIKTVADRLADYKNNGYYIVILSGGYKAYIDFFATEHGVDAVIANEMKVRDGLLTGELLQADCIGKAKIDRYNEFVKNIKETTDENIKEIIFCTDSSSDMPFMEYADKTVIVSKGKHQKWVDTQKYEEIIW